MIQLQGLAKAFGETRALQGVDLHAPKGAVYGLVGPNGAGKTTLIRCLTGVMRPDAGTVAIQGLPVWENPAAKGLMAYIPDDVFYFPAATLADMARYYQGVYPSFDSGRWEKLGQAFDLPAGPIRRMSRGMQKQAAFRLALSLRPQVLVLDEPVDGLDPVMRRQVWGLVLADVAELGVTVLVSSHNLRELEDVCDHVGVMHDGRLLLERALSDLQEGVQKLQVVFPESAADGDLSDGGAPGLPGGAPGLPGGAPGLPGFELLHHSRMGRVQTLILRGRRDELDAAIRPLSPVFYDLLPLSLEEIFIYELGGAHYAVKDILL